MYKLVGENIMDKQTKIIVGVALVVVLVVGLLLGGAGKVKDEEYEAAVQVANDALESVKVANSEKTQLQIELNNRPTQEELDKVKSELDARPTKADVDEVKASLDELRGEIAEKDDKINVLETEVALKEEELAQKEQEPNVVIVDDSVGYKKDELKLGSMYEFSVTDRRVETLFDGEIEFDGNDYDVEETVILMDVLVGINDDDFNENVYLQIPENGVEYVVTFAANLDTSLITEDESLEFDFLGEQIEIVEWDGDEVVFYKGTKELVYEGQSIEYEGYTVEVKVVTEDKVYIGVNGVFEAIGEGETEEIEGLEIKVDSLLEDDDKEDIVILKFGEDVEETARDGDEYEDDSVWNFVITPNSIGLILNEEHVSIDPDEEYRALGEGDEVKLPNDYVTVRFDGVLPEDYEEFIFQDATKGGNDYVRVSGTFVDDITDYDRIYVDAFGIYDEDLVLIDTNSIGLGDSELDLEIVGGYIRVDDFEFRLDFGDAHIVGGPNLSDYDENYRTAYGTIIKDPEDGLDDERLSLTIPEEQLEASITVY